MDIMQVTLLAKVQLDIMSVLLHDFHALLVYNSSKRFIQSACNFIAKISARKQMRG